MNAADAFPVFQPRHLLGINGLSPEDITILLDRAEQAISVSRQPEKKKSVLRGRTHINLFFEASTRTQSSFELAGKRLGADVMNMSVASSSVKKGETLIDTAITLNAMRPDILVIRQPRHGTVECPGVDKCKIQGLCHSARHGALARPRGPIYRHDRLLPHGAGSLLGTSSPAGAGVVPGG